MRPTSANQMRKLRLLKRPGCHQTPASVWPARRPGPRHAQTRRTSKRRIRNHAQTSIGLPGPGPIGIYLTVRSHGCISRHRRRDRHPGAQSWRPILAVARPVVLPPAFPGTPPGAHARGWFGCFLCLSPPPRAAARCCERLRPLGLRGGGIGRRRARRRRRTRPPPWRARTAGLVAFCAFPLPWVLMYAAACIYCRWGCGGGGSVGGGRSAAAAAPGAPRGARALLVW